MHAISTSLGAGFGLALLVACAPVSMPDAPEGATFFADNCVACHGGDARGAGPSDTWLTAQPPDLTVLARNNGGVFPTAQTLSTIWGDPDQGHLARVMPQFGGPMADDLVPVDVEGVLTPTPRALAGVLAYLKSVQR